MTKIRTRASERKRVAKTFSKPSKAKQSFGNECDINNIISQFHRTGQMLHLNEKQPTYGYATSDDFRTALERVENARALFAQIPSEIRQKFDNDPAEFLAFAENADNLPEMARMGLLNEEATQNAFSEENSSESVTDDPEQTKVVE